MSFFFSKPEPPTFYIMTCGDDVDLFVGTRHVIELAYRRRSFAEIDEMVGLFHLTASAIGAQAVDVRVTHRNVFLGDKPAFE